MKKPILIFFLFFLSCENLVAQENNDIVSFRQIPIDLHIQIGFLFVYVLLGLLFLMMFLFYPRQRLNLHFSLYNIFLAAMIINIQFFKSSADSSIATVAQEFISRMIGINILLFILYALDRAKLFYWWLVGVILFIDFPLSLVLPLKYTFVNQAFHALFTIVCFWPAIIAFKSKDFGNWLIGLVALAVVFVNIGSVLYFFGKEEMIPPGALGIIPFIITLCVVVYLALRYGHTNTSLERQLVQVQQLSKENLQKEQEKQLMLAMQNETLDKQVMERTMELRNSLNDLRSAQTQLIQAEKMASLGELTAGIAHEIQNPLNFVNNFSEINSELVEELKAEAEKGNVEEVKSIADDLKENNQKITFHGKRADSIVKGMLQHSRTSTGTKELTDINALADEFLRLSYHGLRAKDKSFNAAMETNFDYNLEKIEVIPQDIGRVLLNLFNNAFYSVNEKKKVLNGLFEPKVFVSTEKMNGKVQIIVRDNGNGIPQKILDKIYQPFFTTKPTGEGTGLGLSLSYDIITKGHNGDLKVETKEGEYALFKIILPIENKN